MAKAHEYFQMEATERLERLSSGLLALERSADDQTLISNLFREAHSLKGAAGVVGLPTISEICHKMEDLLSDIREGTEQASAEMVDALLAATDAVQDLVAVPMDTRDSDTVLALVMERLHDVKHSTTPAAAAASAEAGSATPQAECAPAGPDSAPELRAGAESPVTVCEDLAAEKPQKDTGPPAVDNPSATQAGDTEPSLTPVPASGMDTVHLRVDMLESLADRAGELMVARDRLRQRLGAVREMHNLLRGKCGRPHSDPGIEEALRPIATTARSLVDDLTTDYTVLDPLIAEIHEQVLDTRMLPVGILFDKLQRFVRDYCRQENKQAELHIEGAETRVDRHVLEQLRDPMIHLIRNALSHGIEPSEVRKRLDKNPAGHVRLCTSRHGNRIRVTCEDDGRGIDHQRVLAKAVSTGLIAQDEASGLSTAQIEELTLRHGFSTADMITDVSGRGVGMDVVVRRVEALRGTLRIESELGRFTRFVLEFPASVATLDGLLVEAAGHTYVVPTASIVCTAGINLPRVQTVGGEPTVELDGRAVPLVMLADLLSRSKHAKVAPNLMPAVVVRHLGRHIAVGVERLLDTQTVVTRRLDDHICDTRGVVGATILGTGLPALILDLGRLVQANGTGLPCGAGASGVAIIGQKADPILIVDDSITTRMMEQSILESAGYAVDAAVDAEDALAKIENCDYRLFVVDVEMPGLNGFQLTQKLRQDERCAETPIIIVTSLAKEEHRREGLEVGANAYIVKGEFDQNVLLETVERLVGK
ncbi:MAG: hybrid sensor histidine kinase/response regulator [Planctomycetota bacterium]|jgi:two-component system chemotaxis sensor kinase CheA